MLNEDFGNQEYSMPSQSFRQNDIISSLAIKMLYNTKMSIGLSTELMVNLQLKFCILSMLIVQEIQVNRSH